jgi:hypothetical protein
MGRLKYSVRKFILQYQLSVSWNIIFYVSHIPEIMKNLYKTELELAKTKVKNLLDIKQRY